MVRRAKLPRNSCNQIDRRFVPYGDRSLSGRYDWMPYDTVRKPRRKRTKPKPDTPKETTTHKTKRILVGSSL